MQVSNNIILCKPIQSVQYHHTIIPCISYIHTSVCIMFILSSLILYVCLRASICPSLSACSIRQSKAIKVPVLPTPALIKIQ